MFCASVWTRGTQRKDICAKILYTIKRMICIAMDNNSNLYSMKIHRKCCNNSREPDNKQIGEDCQPQPAGVGS